MLDHADYPARTRQHELDPTDHTYHTDHTDHTYQDYIYLPCLADLHHEEGINDLIYVTEVWKSKSVGVYR